MENCLIVINKSAGSAGKINFDYVKNRLGNRYKYFCHTIPTDGEPKVENYDALAVCGGDGTLSRVLEKVYDSNKQVFYFPYGTLNDKAKIKNANKDSHAVVGETEGATHTVFSYVLAAGSFTPIGYETSVKLKKKIGVLAYLLKVVREYKVHRIHARLTTAECVYSGDFTLIMFLKSPRCFGFKFNKAYDENATSGHLILIRSPKHDGLLGKIEMFFPFFRVFFLGLKNERDGKIIFKQITSAGVNLQDETAFCKDGEKAVFDGDFSVNFVKTTCNLNMINKTQKALYHTKNGR